VASSPRCNGGARAAVVRPTRPHHSGDEALVAERLACTEEGRVRLPPSPLASVVSTASTRPLYGRGAGSTPAGGFRTPVAQWTERCPATAEAAGSTPAGRTTSRTQLRGRAMGAIPRRPFDPVRPLSVGPRVSGSTASFQPPVRVRVDAAAQARPAGGVAARQRRLRQPLRQPDGGRAGSDVGRGPLRLARVRPQTGVGLSRACAGDCLRGRAHDPISSHHGAPRKGACLDHPDAGIKRCGSRSS
jgi:hypothetical protein